jgi:hypothetical protein
MSLIYEGKEYKSKCTLIRELFEKGVITNDIKSKKKMANELKITVQTVHAAINYKKVLKPKSIKKESFIVQSQSIIKEDSIEKKENIIKSHMTIFQSKDPHRIAITWTPNPWGLPVSNPPQIVVDYNWTIETAQQWKAK